ncbi:MAG: hypothetical protein AMK70_15415 [Nitrospira bacterium SG8_35_1]|nr:MAG: hypothetical protein AMK70_15415 [Nitrospira bacterium SG8_35_1]
MRQGRANVIQVYEIMADKRSRITKHALLQADQVPFFTDLLQNSPRQDTLEPLDMLSKNLFVRNY